MSRATQGYAEAVSYAREWKRFAQDRPFKEDQVYLEWMRKVDAERDDVDIFWTDHEGALSSFDVEVVKDFCEGVSLDDLKSGNGTAGKRAAWLDDRCAHRTGKKHNAVTAGLFRRLLKEMVWRGI